MQKTIADLTEYIKAITAEYPGFPEGALSYIVEEINSVQQLYFERFHHESAVYQTPHTSAFTASVLPQEGMAEPCFSDLLAVFLDDTPLPLLDPVSYRASKAPAATMEEGQILYRGEPGSHKQLTVIYRQRPADLLFGDDGVTGEIYIPTKHLPLLGNKIRECISRTVMEYKDADYYAEAFNNWITVLDGYENGTMRAADRARRAL